MYTAISHLFGKTTTAIKLLSTENGRIKLQTLDDVVIYAHTQGIFFFFYKNRGQYVEYYIQLAELMRSENRKGWAAHCYLEAFDMVWRDYQSVAIYGARDKEKERIDPYDLYGKIRIYMVETGNTGGLKRLKENHRKHREYADIELRYAHLSRRREREESIDKLLDMDFDIDNFHCD